MAACPPARGAAGILGGAWAEPKDAAEKTSPAATARGNQPVKSALIRRIPPCFARATPVRGAVIARGMPCLARRSARLLGRRPWRLGTSYRTARSRIISVSGTSGRIYQRLGSRRGNSRAAPGVANGRVGPRLPNRGRRGPGPGVPASRSTRPCTFVQLARSGEKGRSHPLSQPHFV